MCFGVRSDDLPDKTTSLNRTPPTQGGGLLCRTAHEHDWTMDFEFAGKQKRKDEQKRLREGEEGGDKGQETEFDWIVSILAFQLVSNPVWMKNWSKLIRIDRKWSKLIGAVKKERKRMIEQWGAQKSDQMTRGRNCGESDRINRPIGWIGWLIVWNKNVHTRCRFCTGWRGGGRRDDHRWPDQFPARCFSIIYISQGSYGCCKECVGLCVCVCVCGIVCGSTGGPSNNWKREKTAILAPSRQTTTLRETGAKFEVVK